MLNVVTWNCATLNGTRSAALHSKTTALGSADIVLLQETHIANGERLPTKNSLLGAHRRFNAVPHKAVLTYDTGILIRHTSWIIEESVRHKRFTYARVRIPDSEPAVGNGVRVLHIWSIHGPPTTEENIEFWKKDSPNLSRLDPVTFSQDGKEAAIVGADWNAVASKQLDSYPPTAGSQMLPIGLLKRSGLVDAYRVLSPTGMAHTRITIHFGVVTSWRRLDSIWVSGNLTGEIQAVQIEPSLSDHCIVSMSLRTTGEMTQRGPGSWHLHRQAHLQPGFDVKLLRFVASIPARIDSTFAWFEYVERIRTGLFNISADFSKRRLCVVQRRRELVLQLATLDIRRKTASRIKFLRTLESLRQLELAAAAEKSDLVGSLRATAWLAPRLESRSFAAIDALQDERGTLKSDIASKLEIVERSSAKLFTPRESTTYTEEAAAILLDAVGNRLSSHGRQTLAAPYTAEELQAALGSTDEHSAPGMDGLTFPLIRNMGNSFLQSLSCLGNLLLQGHCLPEGQPLSRGVMLPKKGASHIPENYRSICIESAAIRLLNKAASKRLQSVARDILDTSQVGFVAGRNMDNILVTLHLVVHAVKSGNVDGPVWVLSLDQRKAFDRVRREWLLDCLAAYGLGSQFMAYVQELTRHPSVCQTIEGHLSSPIRLKCGLAQGDPLSSLLYNISLQPLLDCVRSDQTGTVVSLDPSNPYLITSLAFVDDVLLFCSEKEELRAFLEALDLYEMASNGEINEEKSRAFQICKLESQPQEGGIHSDDIPFTLCQNQTEIVHLGQPFAIEGGVPQVGLDKLLQRVEAKINLLSSSIPLLKKATICNSFLLSKLWHSLRTCPIPIDLQRRVNRIVSPFLFLGRRNWLRQNYVTAPRHLGGLGVIDSEQMAAALLGQISFRLLSSKEPIGSQFRAALQQHLWDEYGAMPAHFILRTGRPWVKMNNPLMAQKCFLSRVVYTLTQLRMSIAPDWEEITTQELLSLPFYDNMFGFTWSEINLSSRHYWERNGVRVWGDIIWYNPNERGRREHPNVVNIAYPLVPPSAAGVKSNYVVTRGHTEKELFSDACGRHIPSLWKELWTQMKEPIRKKLLDISKHFRIHPDKSKSVLNPRCHDRPFDIDTVGLPFPWRFATLAGKTADEYTVRHARSFLSTSQVIIPDWSFESTEQQWSQVWRWHVQEETLLSAEARSDVFLFLHRRVWLAQKPRKQRRLENYDVLEDDGVDEIPRNVFDPEIQRQQTTDAVDQYEAEHVYGVTQCMLCGTTRDSAAHGYVECEALQLKFWDWCQPTLKKLVDGRSVPTDLKSIVLGWTDLRMTTVQRARLLLWRDAAIHILARRRHLAIAEGIKQDHVPSLSLDMISGEHAKLLAQTLIDGYHQSKARPNYVKRWIEGGVFLKEVEGTLHFFDTAASDILEAYNGEDA